MSSVKTWLDRAAPQVPDAVRDEYALQQYVRLQRQVTLLYASLVLIILAAMISAAWSASPLFSIGVPLLVTFGCVFRLIIWRSRPSEMKDPEFARRAVNRSRLVSGSIACLCSIWAIAVWRSAPLQTSAFVPLFMAMGATATVSCLSMTRLGTFYNVMGGMVPIAMALILSGETMPIAAGSTMLVAGGFIMQLALREHERTIELLVLQQQMRALAETDPLTGLANRRALEDRLETSVSSAEYGQGPSVLLLDLDGFKPVNDRHGHAAGDEVLREVARRMNEVTGEDGIASRIGGDEFAVLVLPTSRRSPEVIGTALLASLARPFDFEGHHLHVGASLGISVWPDDGTTLDRLLRVADRALYVAKAGQDSGEILQTRVHPLRIA